VPTHFLIGALQLVWPEGAKAGQAQHQLARLGRRERAEVQLIHTLRGIARQLERIPAGEQQPALARLPDPLLEKVGQIAPHPPLVVQIVLEVIQQEHKREVREDLPDQQAQPILPGLLGLAGIVRNLAERVALVAASGYGELEQALTELAQDLIAVSRAGERD
jgi:hypothetical protein